MVLHESTPNHLIHLGFINMYSAARSPNERTENIFKIIICTMLGCKALCRMADNMISSLCLDVDNICPGNISVLVSLQTACFF